MKDEDFDLYHQSQPHQVNCFSVWLNKDCVHVFGNISLSGQLFYEINDLACGCKNLMIIITKLRGLLGSVSWCLSTLS